MQSVSKNENQVQNFHISKSNNRYKDFEDVSNNRCKDSENVVIVTISSNRWKV